jgi:hypothetical protein
MADNRTIIAGSHTHLASGKADVGVVAHAERVFVWSSVCRGLHAVQRVPPFTICHRVAGSCTPVLLLHGRRKHLHPRFLCPDCSSTNLKLSHLLLMSGRGSGLCGEGVSCIMGTANACTLNISDCSLILYVMMLGWLDSHLLPDVHEI